MASSHFASAHFSATHFLSNHFSGGALQVVVVPIGDISAGGDGLEELLIRVPNGHIVIIAAAALIIMDDDLDY